MAVDIEVRHHVACDYLTGADCGADTYAQVYGGPLAFVGADVVIVGFGPFRSAFYAHPAIGDVEHHAGFGIERPAGGVVSDAGRFEHEGGTEEEVRRFVVVAVNVPVRTGSPTDFIVIRPVAQSSANTDVGAKHLMIRGFKRVGVRRCESPAKANSAIRPWISSHRHDRRCKQA